MIWEKCDEWRKRNPGRANELRVWIAKHVHNVGAASLVNADGTAKAFVAEFCTPTENALLRIVYAMQDDNT
jgi:hypothetical protein